LVEAVKGKVNGSLHSPPLPGLSRRHYLHSRGKGYWCTQAGRRFSQQFHLT